MAYTVTIESASILEPLEHARSSAPAVAAPPGTETIERRRLKRMVAYGPRCPDCTGPLVFGEGCNLCPVCGYSACGGWA